MVNPFAALLPPIVSFVQPFADRYAASQSLQVGTTFAHFAGLLTGGGFAVASDRLVWRQPRMPDADRRMPFLDELDAVHRPVLIGLTITIVSGLLMTAADAEVMLTSVTFWSKMGVIVLLLLNGAWLVRISERLRRAVVPAASLWRNLHISAAVSLTGWLAVTLLGVILTNG